MNESSAMGVVQCLSSIDSDTSGLGKIKKISGVEHCPQGTTIEQFGDEIGHLALPPVVHRHDVPVVQCRCGASFCLETFEERNIARKCIVENFDRDATTKNHVIGQVDSRGGPGADGGQQPVAPPEHLTDAVGSTGVGHGMRLVLCLADFGHPQQGRDGKSSHPRPAREPRAGRLFP